MSKKETRRIYCDEEELEYAKHCIQQRRAGLVLQNIDGDPNGSLEKKIGDPNGSLEKKIADISEALDCIIQESLPDLERRLTERINAIRR